MTVLQSAALDEALQKLSAAREKAEDVKCQAEAYRAELEALEAAQTPERALDDPEGAAEDGDRCEALRRRAALTDSALSAAKDRVAKARSAALLVEAELHGQAVTVAEEALKGHLAETERLRDALTQHTREYWTPSPLAVDPVDQHVDFLDRPHRAVWSSREEQLRIAVHQAHTVVEALRAAAQGQSPPLPLEQTPVCMRPGGWAHG